MDVQIITPDKSLYEGKADLVNVPGTSGSIGILNNHAPLVSSLSKGEVRIVLNDKEEIFNIDGGAWLFKIPIEPEVPGTLTKSALPS
jgi:F-type H+-transporting ATPase subunit epsilon